MNLDEYQQLAHKTSAFTDTQPIDDRHVGMAILGLCGETGELADLFKKHVYHNHTVDITKVKLELGDILWYVAEACTAFGFTLDEIAGSNIAKLSARYGEAFSSEASINRKDS